MADELDTVDALEARPDNVISQQAGQATSFFLAPFYKVKDGQDWIYWMDTRMGSPWGNTTTPAPKLPDGKLILPYGSIYVIRPLRHEGKLVEPAKITKDGKEFLVPMTMILVKFNSPRVIGLNETPDFTPSRSLTTCFLEGFLRYQSRDFTDNNTGVVTTRTGYHGESCRNQFLNFYPAKTQPEGVTQGMPGFKYTLQLKGGGRTSSPQTQPTTTPPTRKEDPVENTDNPF